MAVNHVTNQSFISKSGTEKENLGAQSMIATDARCLDYGAPDEGNRTCSSVKPPPAAALNGFKIAQSCKNRAPKHNNIFGVLNQIDCIETVDGALNPTKQPDKELNNFAYFTLGSK